MADIVVFGAGQIADVARTYIDAHGPDRIVGFTVDAAFRRGDSFAGRPLVDWEHLERYFPPNQVKLLGPLSYRRLNEFRRNRHREGKERGYSFASFIHPACHNYAEHIGENTFILESNIIQPFVRIGDGVMMWSGNHIGHHCIVGDYCFFASQVGLGSGVQLGDECFLLGKAGVESGLRIGPRSFLGTAVIVRKHLEAGSVVLASASTIAEYSSSRLKRLL